MWGDSDQRPGTGVPQLPKPSRAWFPFASMVSVCSRPRWNQMSQSCLISYSEWLWDIQGFDKTTSVNFYSENWRTSVDSEGEGWDATPCLPLRGETAPVSTRCFSWVRVWFTSWASGTAPFMGVWRRLGKLVDMIESRQLGADRGGDAPLSTRLRLCLVFPVDSPRDHNAVFPCSPRPRRLFSDVATGR